MRIILAAALLLATPALAQQQQAACFPPADLVAALERENGEQPTSTGIAGGGRFLFVLFTSQTGETWTLAVHTPQGLCIMAAGKDWQNRPFKPKERES